MSFDEAVRILKKEHPDLKTAGFAYKYNGDYYISMVDKTCHGIPFDGLFIVDGKTKKTRLFINGVDKAPDFTKIEMI